MRVWFAQLIPRELREDAGDEALIDMAFEILSAEGFAVVRERPHAEWVQIDGENLFFFPAEIRAELGDFWFRVSFTEKPSDD